MNRWRYAAAQTETKNVARIVSVSFRLGARPAVVIDYEIGDDTSGTFVPNRRSHVEMGSPLPAVVTTLIDNINTRALAYLASRGIIPDGTEEPDVTEAPTR